jgi:A/G-specific adenine glycosylase
VQRGQLSQEMLQRVLWLRERLLCWFEQHRRSFPWREPVRSSYELVVAEILLQRTTAAKVAHAFPSFVDRYPTWEAVASTPLEELQISIRPLGLWRQKAQVFLDLANEVEKNRGVLPCSRRDLERLPGVGPYTAGAVMLAVYGLHEPFIDVNMARVLSRFFRIQACDSNIRSAFLDSLAFHLVRCECCLSVNWAVLDLGALVCHARNPLCQKCPLREECRFLSESSSP